MSEYKLYEYVRDMYRRLCYPFYCPLTEGFIVQLVGRYGFDILKNANLIASTEHPGQYVLCCEE